MLVFNGTNHRPNVKSCRCSYSDKRGSTYSTCARADPEVERVGCGGGGGGGGILVATILDTPTFYSSLKSVGGEAPQSAHDVPYLAGQCYLGFQK